MRPDSSAFLRLVPRVAGVAVGGVVSGDHGLVDVPGGVAVFDGEFR